MMKRRLISTLFLVSSFYTSFAQPGTLDGSYNGSGTQTLSFRQNISIENVYGSAMDAKGNLYITGSTTTSYTLPYVIKVLPDGKLDPSFGSRGKVTLDIMSPYTFFANAIAIDPNGGGIVLAGYNTTSQSTYAPCLVKLLSNGVVDPNFNYSGTGFSNFPYSPAVSGDGAMFTKVKVVGSQILATGSTASKTDPSSNFLIVCLNLSNGYIVEGWGDGNSLQTIDFNGTTDYCTSAALDGTELYMAGSSKDVNGYDHFSVAAINITSGVVDTSVVFSVDNTNGVLSNTCNAILINGNHELFMGGYASDASGNNAFMVHKALARPTSQSLYTKYYTLGTSTDSKAYSMAFDGNQNIVLGGSSKNVVSGVYNWTAIRVKTIGGALDTGFGSGGIQYYTTTCGSYDGINNIIRLSDGSYLLPSTYAPASGATDIKVKKVNAKGTPVTAYANKSEATFWMTDAESIINDIVVKPDGQQLVCGSYTDVANGAEVAVIALLKNDGSFNESFGGTAGADPGVIAFQSPTFPIAVVYNASLSAIALQSDGKILVAGKCQDASTTEGILLLRLNKDGSWDNSFNSNGGGYNLLMNSTGTGTTCYVHDIAFQSTGKILLYGYYTQSIALLRYNTDGTSDGSFASSGIYIQPNSTAGDLDVAKIGFKVRPLTDKIVCAGSYTGSGANDFLVFHLGKDGGIDQFFGTNGSFTMDIAGSNLYDLASSVCLKPNGSILVGGYSTDVNYNIDYTMLQLSAAGQLDTTFGTHGIVVLNEGYGQQGIVDLQMENTNNILAAGVAEFVSEGGNKYYVTAMRFKIDGTLDNTFAGQGHTVVSQGYTKASALSGGNLYIGGVNDKPDNDPHYAFIAKLKLGTGAVVKLTRLQLSDVNKTFGDDPFVLRPVTNSNAPILYSISNGSCATVDAKTGLVTITCVPLNSYDYIEIKAVQPATYGYTGDSAFAAINVAKAIPKIIFNTQGGIVDSTITLLAISNSPADATFDLVQNDNNALSYVDNGILYIAGEGCGQVQVSYPETQNYLYGNATANICGYLQLIVPSASDDQVTMTYPLDSSITIYPLENDEAYTGVLVPADLDLDPSTPGIQHEYISAALGKFDVDSLGTVTYTPFEGFIGSGSIAYTITDTEGSVSTPAKIGIDVTSPTNAPALKATELFTPNNDGLNDKFVIGYVDLAKQNQLKIFDRNGEELFTQNNYKNDWNGDLPNGKKAENGIYFYLFTEGSDGNERELKGVVELKR